MWVFSWLALCLFGARRHGRWYQLVNAGVFVLQFFLCHVDSNVPGWTMPQMSGQSSNECKACSNMMQKASMEALPRANPTSTPPSSSLLSAREIDPVSVDVNNLDFPRPSPPEVCIVELLPRHPGYRQGSSCVYIISFAHGKWRPMPSWNGWRPFHRQLHGEIVLRCISPCLGTVSPMMWVRFKTRQRLTWLKDALAHAKPRIILL